MDSATRDEYPSVLETDWLNLGYPPIRDSPTKDLHPLFRRIYLSRPSGEEHNGPQYKSEQEEDKMCAVMRPILQLASNMLVTPKSLDFLYQVAFSPRKSIRGEHSEQGRLQVEFGWTEPHDQRVGRQMTKDTLHRLSRSLTFYIADPRDSPDVEENIAFTNPVVRSSGDGVKINDVSRISGVESMMTLNKKYITMLKGLDTQEGDSEVQKMIIQFVLAKTLCHEVAHALAFAVNGELLEKSKSVAEALVQAQKEGRIYEMPAFDEPFFRDEAMAEIGICWENQVFGGKIMWEGTVNDALFVSKWPSFLSGRDSCVRRRKEEKRTARKYIVPLHFIKNMHRKGFWDDVIPGDVSALYIKKTIGIEYLKDDPNLETLPFNFSQINWLSKDGSRRVDKESGGQPVPDPSASHANETEHERFLRELASASGV